jgi:hypothetical protein
MQLKPDIAEQLARAGLGIAEFAELAEVDRTIFYRVGRPLRPKTAWKIANAYASKTGITPDQACAQLIAQDSEQAPTRSTPDTGQAGRSPRARR